MTDNPQSQQGQGQGQSKRMRLELPSNLNVTYANAVVINQSHSEIIMDFIQVMPNDPRARVQQRVVMTPANAKSFLQALQKNLDNYEAKHGEINLPPRPTSLADQLFSQARRDEDEDDGGEDDDDGSST